MDCYDWCLGRLDLDQESRHYQWQLDRQTHRLHRDDRLMKAIRCVGFALVALAAFLPLADPSHADSAVVITLDPSCSTPN
jgi:hypothetical protein